MSTMTAQVRDPKTYAFIGAAMEIHGELRNGFLEAVYKDVLEIEFAKRSVPFCREVELPIYYKGQRIKSYYRADFICFDSVLVEVKAIRQISAVDRAQVINYLKAARIEVAVLLNFGSQSLEYERIVLSSV